MSAMADTKREVRCATRTARGLRRRQAKDHPAGLERQAQRRGRFRTFAPAGGVGVSNRPAATPATRGDRSGRRHASMYDDREPRHRLSCQQGWRHPCHSWAAVPNPEPRGVRRSLRPPANRRTNDQPPGPSAPGFRARLRRPGMTKVGAVTVIFGPSWFETLLRRRLTMRGRWTYPRTRPPPAAPPPPCGAGSGRSGGGAARSGRWRPGRPR